MTEQNTKNFIDDIVKLSKECDSDMSEKVSNLVEIYEKQKKAYEEIQEENNSFIEKWNQQNILVQEQDAQKDKILEQHSRQAAMGEMIDAVAHQWKQPLNSISMIIDMLKDDFQKNNVDIAYINDLDKTVHMQIDHMVNTLSEFRNFLRPTTKDENFNLKNVVENVQVLMKDELLSQNVNLTTNIEDSISLQGNKNEFKHIFLNLISNSIDAFNEKNIQNRLININAYTEDEFISINIQDNAGGIGESVLNEIFKPNFTTKSEGKGTGIGLYMCSQIVKKNHGYIDVENSSGGTLFKIKLRQLTT